MNILSSLISYISLIIILLVLVISPFPYGSVEDWAKLLFQFQSFFLLLLLTVFLILTGKSLRINNKLAALCILSFFCLIILQMIPFPPSILKFLSNGSLEIWETNKKILNQIGLPQEGNLFTISLYPYGTFKEMILLLAYFSFGIVTAFFLNNRNRVTYFIYLIFLITFVEASIGLYQMIYLGDKATGSYINKNHYAGFLELTTFLLIGFALSQRDYGSAKKGLRTYFRDLLASDRLFKQITIIIAISFTSISLFISESRMAIFSFLVTAVLMYLLARRYSRESPAEKILIAFMVFMTLCYVVFINFYGVFKRFVETVGEAPGRTHMWRDSLNIFIDFPIFGTGLDTFKFIYAKYKTLEIASSINFAHNDYLQLLVETGIIGFTLIMIPLYIFLKTALGKIKYYSSRRDFFAAYVRLGALCGIISILIHSLVDFNLHIPANAIYFSFLIGLILSDFDGGSAEKYELTTYAS